MAFEYRELDISKAEIRLLSLLPGVRAAEIGCKITHASLNDLPEYEALSYTWEDGENPGQRFSIHLDGQVFEVNNNLMAALQHLRHEDRERVLWIDAICINQAKDEVAEAEKREQMKVMGEIYNKAKIVVCWLGVASQGSDYAMELIRRVTQESTAKDILRVLRSIVGLLGSFMALQPVYRGVPWRKSRSFGDEEWKAIDSLLNRKYWSRTWIIQEQTVARGDPLVVCGHCSLHLSAFIRFQRAAGRHDRPHHIFLGFTDHHVERLKLRDEYERHGKVDLETLLIRSSIFEAFEPKDKILALRELMEQRHRPFLEVQDSTSCADLCSRLTLHILKDEGNLRILSRVIYALQPHFERYEIKGGQNVDKNCVAPSWVPKLYRTHLGGQAWLWRGGPKEYQASGDTSPIIQHDLQRPDVLSIKGFLVDQIVEVTTEGPRPLQNLDAIPKMARTTFRALGRASTQNKTPTPKSYNSAPAILCENILKGTRNAIASGQSHHVFNGPVDEAMMRRFMILEDFLVYTRIARHFHRITGVHLRPLELPPKQLFEIAEVWIRMILNSVLCKRSFFSTQKGYIGIGPLDAEPGDTVCVFYGGEAFYVIRGAGEENGRQQNLMGDAYVHGMMKGEAMQLRDEGQHKERYFHLI